MFRKNKNLFRCGMLLLLFILPGLHLLYCQTGLEESLFGDGSDGDIVIHSGYTVNITALYENENVAGVTTKYGVGRGLGYGSGKYQPQTGQFLNARNFIIEAGATLTASALGSSRDFRRGVVAVRCTGNFINYGYIKLDNLGFTGGSGDSAYGTPGLDPGQAYSGYGGVGARTTRGAAGGQAYPFRLDDLLQDQLLINWEYLYGSGGGGGKKMKYCGGDGGAGGGAFVAFVANIFDTRTGSITANGQSGWGGNNTGDRDEGCSGGGGGGAGGTVYTVVKNFAFLGNGRMTAAAGPGGSGADGGSRNPDHGGGGGGGGNRYSGASGGNGGTRSSGAGGRGSVGRIHVSGPYQGFTSNPPLF